MTKTQEIEGVAEFVASLPRESYLYSMFGGAVEYVADLIKSDIAIEPLPQLMSAIYEAQQDKRRIEKETQAVLASKRELESAVMALEERAREARQDLQTVNAIASRLCRVS